MAHNNRRLYNMRYLKPFWLRGVVDRALDTTVMARSSTLPEVLDSMSAVAGEVAQGVGE